MPQGLCYEGLCHTTTVVQLFVCMMAMHDLVEEKPQQSLLVTTHAMMAVLQSC